MAPFSMQRRSAEPTAACRRGLGWELKPSYYRQALKNVKMAAEGRRDIEENTELFSDIGES